MKPESGFGQILLLDSGNRVRGEPEAWNVSDVGCAHPDRGIFNRSGSPYPRRPDYESRSYRRPF